MTSLGFLVWFSVHNTSQPLRLPLAVAHDWFTELGLDRDHLPRTLLPVDAFHAASSTTTCSYVDDITGEKVELRSVRIRQTPARHERHVLRYVQRSRTSLSTSAKLIEMTFQAAPRTSTGRRPVGHRVTHVIVPRLVEASMSEAGKIFAVSEQDVAMAKAWLKDFHVEYELLQNELRADQVRTVVRDYLVAWDAVLANNKGGVYFLPPGAEKVLTALQTFVTRISDECFLHIVTLSDTAENRRTVHSIWWQTIEADLHRLEATMLALKNAGAWKQMTFPAFRTQILGPWESLRGRALAYAEMDGTSSGEVDTLLEPIAAVVAMLSQRILRSSPTEQESREKS